VHAVTEVHDTPVRKLIGAPAGAGIRWTLQLVPSHLSAITCRLLLFPTAVHAFADVQETAFRNAPGLPEVGVGWMLQLVPSQRSASVPPSGLVKMPSKAPPTAKHADGDVHDTPLRRLALPAAPAGFGVGVIRHAVPSHSSATVPFALAKGSEAWPTAMQAEDDLHDTAKSFAPRAPCGLTVGWALHSVPSHPWPRVMTVPEASNPSPTATQEEAAGHATPDNRLPPGAFWVVCRLHLWPSQRSATVDAVFELSKLAPTAVQADDDEHDTLLKKAPCDPVGFGVDFTVHVVPFHCSPSVTPEALDPTDEQAKGEVHETENSAAPGLCAVGADWIVHFVPFQRAASVPWSVCPTASHAVDETHETPIRTPNCAPGGFGVDCTDQVEPFHCSTSVWWTPELSV
jgi:hypothetical protein